MNSILHLHIFPCSSSHCSPLFLFTFFFQSQLPPSFVSLLLDRYTSTIVTLDYSIRILHPIFTVLHHISAAMHSTQMALKLVALAAAVSASPFALPQGVTSNIAPKESAPAGCKATHGGMFGIAMEPVKGMKRSAYF